MENTSWSLRLALLLIGLALLGVLYLWAAWRRRREQNRRYDRRTRGIRPSPRSRHREPDEGGWEDAGEDPGLDTQTKPPSAADDDFEIVVVRTRAREPIEELPTITRDPEPEARAEPLASEPIAPEPTASRTSRRRRGNQLDLGFDDLPAMPARERAERGGRRERRATRERIEPPPAAPAAATPEVLALFLRPARADTFPGPAIARALEAVGMHFGEMNIYHHFGAGELRAEQPLFSLANMFEPGQFDPEAFEDFTTAGLAMFIRFPAALDGPVSFELFLNTAQRLAEALDAELLSEPRTPLDSATIENMRTVAARYSDERS
jgi:cell division protein ZipA